MIAGAGRTFPEHVIKGTSRNDVNILKSGVIYGANASGKSNLVKSIAFAKKLILKGTESKEVIPVKPFRLDVDNVIKPSKFEFEFKHKGVLYAYGFVANAEQIQEEWLYKIGKTVEKLVFERKTDKEQQTTVRLGVKLDTEEEQFFKFLAKGTRPNQLFVTEAIDRNAKGIEAIIHCFEWFYDVLHVIFPESKYLGLDFGGDSDSLIKNFSKFLKFLGTGIEEVVTKTVGVEEAFKNLPDKLKEAIKIDLRELSSTTKKSMLISVFDKLYNIQRDENNELKVTVLKTKHQTKQKTDEVLFDIEDESDGTQRLFDLIPALIDLTNEERVYIIDELDRSMHALLSISLLKLFFQQTQNQHSQLIVTTHEAALLDLNLLRKDEIWFVEKNKWGASKAYSLEEFKPRYDKDIRRGYLQGRYGAIPFIGDLSIFDSNVYKVTG